jgi:hypothetical protein
MAELHVQRKRKSSWLLWLIVILIIAVVLYYLYTQNYLGGNTMTGLYRYSEQLLKLCA